LTVGQRDDEMTTIRICAVKKRDEHAIRHQAAGRILDLRRIWRAGKLPGDGVDDRVPHRQHAEAISGPQEGRHSSDGIAWRFNIPRDDLGENVRA
jgi:hypothetical protein